jgi:hypothetical protein
MALRTPQSTRWWGRHSRAKRFAYRRNHTLHTRWSTQGGVSLKKLRKSVEKGFKEQGVDKARALELVWGSLQRADVLFKSK